MAPQWHNGPWVGQRRGKWTFCHPGTLGLFWRSRRYSCFSSWPERRGTEREGITSFVFHPPGVIGQKPKVTLAASKKKKKKDGTLLESETTNMIPVKSGLIKNIHGQMTLLGHYAKDIPYVVSHPCKGPAGSLSLPFCSWGNQGLGLKGADPRFILKSVWWSRIILPQFFS